MLRSGTFPCRGYDLIRGKPTISPPRFLSRNLWAKLQTATIKTLVLTIFCFPLQPESCLRKNRVKKDDVFVEMPLFELEIMYGSTEAGRRYCFPSAVSFQFRFVLFDLICGQGVHRGHQEIPAWQASPRPPGVASCLTHTSLIGLIVLFLNSQKTTMAVQEQPEVSGLQSLQAHRAQEWAWLDWNQVCLHVHLLLIIFPCGILLWIWNCHAKTPNWNMRQLLFFVLQQC